jgi:hypothetical protein
MFEGAMIRQSLIGLVLGAIAGLIDVTPMAMNGVGRSDVIAAFLHWVVVGLVTAHIRLPLPGFATGIAVALLVALPVIGERLSEGRPVAGLLLMAVVLGAGVGWTTGRLAR